MIRNARSTHPVMLEVTCVALSAVAVCLAALGTDESRVLLLSISVGLVVGGLAVVELTYQESPSSGGLALAWSKWSGAGFVAIAAAGILNSPMRVSYELSRGAADEAAYRVVGSDEFAQPGSMKLFGVAVASAPDDCLASAAEENAAPRFLSED